jgi:hypothetical protein
LFLALQQAGARVSVINPVQSKYFAASISQCGKNEPMDDRHDYVAPRPEGALSG